MPKFQRRQYIQLAAMIADLHLDALDRGDMFLLSTVDVFRDRLIEVFTRDNPRFTPDRFRAACETGSVKPKRQR